MAEEGIIHKQMHSNLKKINKKFKNTDNTNLSTTKETNKQTNKNAATTTLQHNNRSSHR